MMKDIEAKHFDLHTAYLNIFAIYFPDAKKGLFAKIFSSTHKVSAEAQAEAQEQFKVLKSISNELTEMLGRLERRLTAIR